MQRVNFRAYVDMRVLFYQMLTLYAVIVVLHEYRQSYHIVSYRFHERREEIFFQKYLYR